MLEVALRFVTVLLVAAVALLAWLSIRRRTAALAEAADRLGFHRDSGPRHGLDVLHGVHDGIEVDVRVIEVERLDVSDLLEHRPRPRTERRLQFEFGFDRLPLRFRLTPQGARLPGRRRAEATDVTTGDDEFDRSVVARGPPERLREFLDPARRRAVLDFFAEFDDAEVRRDGCSGHIASPRSADRIVDAVRHGTALANELLY